MTDDELRNLVASIAISQPELVEKQKELTEQQKKTDEQLVKTDVQLAKTDAQLAQTDALAKKIGRRLDRVTKLVGNIANNQGEMVEEYFYRSFLKKTGIGRHAVQFHSAELEQSQRRP
jgi:enoyl-[acyl-carrier-protein] reductase (NADH)